MMSFMNALFDVVAQFLLKKIGKKSKKKKKEKKRKRKKMWPNAS